MSSPDDGNNPRTTDDIRHDIESTREELAETVDALSAKTDVKARTSAKLGGLQDQAHAAIDQTKAKAQDAQQRVRDVATDHDGRLVPVGTAGAVVFLVTAAVVAILVVRRRRR
ncbi:MAG: hypothetical protein JWO46_984 [Nocardioidaceae bacterium]|nr:hypothetical protein [Nocardioidaceae bacterium]